jgi:hypothetical protein
VILHDDLLENNIHIDENIGQIMGIINWQDAMIASFAVSLRYLENVLNVQTERTRHPHHDHISPTKQFQDTFYGSINEVSEVDNQSMATVRLFGLYRLHGHE